MKVAIVLPRTESVVPGRAGAITLTVLDYLRHSRHAAETRVLAPPPGHGYPGPGRYVAVAQRGWWRKATLAYAAGCAAALRSDPPAVIEVHNRVEIFDRLAAAFPDSAVCLHFHNDPLTMRGARTVAERRGILARAAAVFCVSDFLRRRLLEGVGAAANVHVLYNAVDPDAWPPCDKQPVLLYVGRMVAEKGALDFARAAAQVLPGLPDWRVVMVGSNRPGETAVTTDYERRVLAALEPLGERARYHSFLPHDQVMARFAEAAVAAVPSVWPEPFGRTALEAMAAGCALVTSGRGGLAEVAGKAALIVEPETAALADALRRLAGDAAERCRLQRAAVARVRNAFDVRKLAAGWDRLREAACT